MIILKITLSIISAIVVFILTAIMSDIVIVNILGINVRGNFNAQFIQRMLLVASLPIGFVFGWKYLYPIIKNKYFIKFKNIILNRFDNFDTMKSRIYFSITCFFIVYYFGFCILLIWERANPLVVITNKEGAFYFWFPMFLFLTFKFIEWIIKGKK